MPITTSTRTLQPGSFSQKMSDGLAHVLARDQWNYTVVDLATDAEQVISAAPAELGHIYVETVMSAHDCPVIDGSTTLFNLLASSARGTAVTWCKGMRFESSLRINSNDAATGTIIVMWRPI